MTTWETGIDIISTGSGTRCYISTDRPSLVRKLVGLIQEHPKECKIIKLPEDNDGALYAIIPDRWIKISLPRQVNLTDEQRAAMAERLKKYREKESKHDE